MHPNDDDLTLLFTLTADGVLIVEQGNLRRINPAAIAMLNLTADWADKPVQELFLQNAPLLDLLTNATELTCDIPLEKQRIAAGICQMLPNQRRLVILHDVTEQRALDSRRDELIKTVVHDIRNPLSAAAGFMEIIEKIGGLKPAQEKHLTRVYQTITRLQEVLPPIIELAWLESGMPLERQPLELGQIIQRAIEDVTPLAYNRNASITSSIQHPMPSLMGDPSRLQLAIFHLLHNAITYSEIEQPIVIHAWGTSDSASISVADRGFGIAPEEINSVFNRLYRSKDERVREIPGGGIGLTLVRTIIKRHGGSITVTSERGVGSTFTVSLPIAQA